MPSNGNRKMQIILRTLEKLDTQLDKVEWNLKKL